MEYLVRFISESAFNELSIELFVDDGISSGLFFNGQNMGVVYWGIYLHEGDWG